MVPAQHHDAVHRSVSAPQSVSRRGGMGLNPFIVLPSLRVQIPEASDSVSLTHYMTMRKSLSSEPEVK